MFNKILVGIDGSEPANNALRYAIDLASKWSAELLILTVIPKIYSTFYLGEFTAFDIDKWEDSLRKSHEGIINKAEEKLKEILELKFNTIIKKGKASSTILQTSKQENVDLIVLGSRGIGGLTGYLLGSTSKHVIDHCQSPVLIIK